MANVSGGTIGEAMGGSDINAQILLRVRDEASGALDRIESNVQRMLRNTTAGYNELFNVYSKGNISGGKLVNSMLEQSRVSDRVDERWNSRRKTLDEIGKSYDNQKKSIVANNVALGQELIYLQQTKSMFPTAAHVVQPRITAIPAEMEANQRKIEQLEVKTEQRRKLIDEAEQKRSKEKVEAQSKADAAMRNTFTQYRTAEQASRGLVLTGDSYRRQLKEIEKGEKITGQTKQTLREKIQLTTQAYQDNAIKLRTAQERVSGYNKDLRTMEDATGRTAGKMLMWAAGWWLAYRAIRVVQSAIVDTYQATINWDRSMVELMMITGKTRTQVEATGGVAIEMATRYSMAIDQVLEGYKIWTRAGYDLQTTTKAMNATLLMSNVSMIGMADSASYLTAIMREYNLRADDLVGITDKWVKLDMVHATTVQNLAEAFKATGSSAYEFGVTIDELNALVTIATETTQRSGNEIGRAFKMIFTRMYRPETIQDLWEISKVTGIAEGGMRDIYTVLGEVAGKWDTLSLAQKRALSESLAGERQSTTLMAVLGNWTRVQDALNESLNAGGDAQQRNETRMEALDKRFAKFGPTLTNFQKNIGMWIVSIGNLDKKLEDINFWLDRHSEKIKNYSEHTILARQVTEQFANSMPLYGEKMKSMRLTLDVLGFRDQIQALRKLWSGTLKGFEMETSYRDPFGFKNFKGIDYATRIKGLAKWAQDNGLISKSMNLQRATLKQLEDALIAADQKYLDTTPEAKARKAAEEETKANENLYYSFLLVSDALKFTKINMELLTDEVDFAKRKIEDLATTNKIINDSLGAQDREWMILSTDYKKANAELSVYTKALDVTNTELMRSTKNFDLMAEQYINQIRYQRDSKTGLLSERAEYTKNASAIQDYVSAVSSSTDPLDKALKLKALIGFVTAEYGKNEEYASEKVKENTDAIIEQFKAQAEYRKNVLDTIAAVEEMNRKNLMAADTVRGPLVDSIHTFIKKGFGGINEAAANLATTLSDVIQKTWAERIINLTMEPVVRAGEAGMAALRSPEDYKAYLESAGLTVGNIWDNVFSVGAAEVASAITNASISGSNDIATSMMNAGDYVAAANAKSIGNLQVAVTGGGGAGVSPASAMGILAVGTAARPSGPSLPPGYFPQPEGYYPKDLNMWQAIPEGLEEAFTTGKDLLDDSWDAAKEVFSKEASWYQRPLYALQATGEAVAGAATVATSPIYGVGKGIAKGFEWTQEKFWSKPVGRVVEAISVSALIQRAGIDDLKNTWAQEGASIGSMAGSLLGPGGPLIGTLLGMAVGKHFKKNEDGQDAQNETLDSIKGVLDSSFGELSIVNRNLVALRQKPEPYPMREQYYFRPYEFGPGPFASSGGYKWGKAPAYNQEGGQKVSIANLTFNVTSDNPDDVVDALQEALALKNISLYQGR
jgi:TP901 family phage tail tape measure protein